jgi:hypothetical protein
MGSLIPGIYPGIYDSKAIDKGSYTLYNRQKAHFSLKTLIFPHKTIDKSSYTLYCFFYTGVYEFCQDTTIDLFI